MLGQCHIASRAGFDHVLPTDNTERTRPDSASDELQSRKAAPLYLGMLVSALSAGLLAFSQTVSWWGDEGFHLLAARLINTGKRPYLDFFYPQTPLYAYLNAAWMRIFGETWRSAHAFSGLLTAGCIALVAGFVYSRLCDRAWRLAGAITAALLVGLHFYVIQFGTVGQAYGLCMFLSVASYVLVVEAASRSSGFLPLGAGLCAGAAPASSLLSAPVVPVLLFWMWRHNRDGDRKAKALRFLAGAALPFLPLLWLAAHSPRRVLFNVVEFHLLHRREGFDRIGFNQVTRWDLKVLSGWLDSTQGLLLVVLAALGLLFVAGSSDWDPRRRAEFRLCAWLAGALSLYLATPHPTLPQYFVLVVPFAGILASLGVYATGVRIWRPDRAARLVLAAVGLFALGLGRSAYAERRSFQFGLRHIEDLAREINQVTPNNGLLWADDETVYFVAQRLPPPGMEHLNAGRLELPPGFAAFLHVVLRSQVEERLAAGGFATVLIWPTDPRVESMGLPRLYARRKTVHGYDLFWDRLAPQPEPAGGLKRIQ
ncbi:MAG: glycosyltransferase family 39 protein [Acidobacteria bacterium]|nr:glycosyltransferase family 39 protein [Acidobacteriota bacterium]